MVKITSMELENVKRIKAVSLTPHIPKVSALVDSIKKSMEETV